MDSGSSGHFLDSQLLPGIDQHMVEYTKLDPPMNILTAGRHLLYGTAKGVLNTIAVDSEGNEHCVKLPAVIVPGLGKHLFSPVEALLRGASTIFPAIHTSTWETSRCRFPATTAVVYSTSA